MDCEVCESNPATVEAVLFPTEVTRLFAMMARHADDLDAWPSFWACDECAALTDGAFRDLVALAPSVLVLVSSDVLLGVARETRRRKLADG